MAIDGTGRVYLAWPDRGYAAVRSDPVTGDSRIVVSTSANGSTWTVPRPVQTDGIGHQLMPQLTFHGGKLRLLYYDLREDVSGLFGPFIDELPILTGPIPRIRHTIDVFVAQALPGSTPAFTTARVSDYARGFMPGSTVEERLQFNPPNLPLFRQGAAPFMGDYIDLAPAPPFVLNDAGRLGPQRRRVRERRVARLLGRQPRRPRTGRWELGELHAGDLGRGRDAEPLRPDADRPGLRGRPGRHAQPERLHGARDRWPVRVGSWQQQVVQRIPARVRHRRRERDRVREDLPAAHREPADRRSGLVPAVRPGADHARCDDAGAVVGRADGVRDLAGRGRADPRVADRGHRAGRRDRRRRLHRQRGAQSRSEQSRRSRIRRCRIRRCRIR